MKKVLIITYYWPPSGGGGVQRWLKFAKYLPEFGWGPIIFTPENPDFDTTDDSLLKDVDANIEILKLSIWEPYHLFAKVNKGKNLKQGVVAKGKKQSWITKFALFVRGNFFIPDPRKFWVKPAVNFLSRYILENDIKTIITTGPPHSMHLIGLGLKKKISVKWLADFRDPWSRWDMLDNFHLTGYAKWRHSRLEKAVLTKADEVLTVSDTWASEFKNILNREYKVITNGFDESDFESTEPIKHDKFVISHFGLINNFRNPVNFWKAIKQLAELPQNKNKLKVQLFGTIDSAIIKDIKSDEVLSELIEFKAPVSHDEVLKAYATSDLLLLLLNDSKNAKGHIPGKLFEYMASQKPILALGPNDGDSAKIISSTRTGTIFHWGDREGVKDQLDRHLKGEKNASVNQELLEHYTRRNLTLKLAEVLNKMV
jgi:glycosyltransferase involved in cell wall biosynthesis